MLRINGYLTPGWKSGGRWTQAWIFLPSKESYQIISGSVSLICEKRVSLMFVRRRSSFVAVSRRKISPMLVGVEMATTMRDVSAVAL